jgi:integrase/recombinase XerD
MTDPQLPTQITPTNTPLTAAEFQRLTWVSPETQCLNLGNDSTKRAYENAVGDFHLAHRHCPPGRIPDIDARP